MCLCVCERERVWKWEQSPVPAELSQPTSHTDYQHSRHRRPTQRGGEEEEGGGQRWSHTHKHRHTHRYTQTHSNEPNRHWCSCRNQQVEVKINVVTNTNTHTPERAWQPAIHPTTQDDILPAQQEREQPSTLMRRLTFSRLWHTETEQFRLIHQISCFCQALAHNGVRYLFPCIPLSHITVPTRNTVLSHPLSTPTRACTHTQPPTHVVNLATIRKARKNKVKGSIWLLRSSTDLPRYRQRDAF